MGKMLDKQPKWPVAKIFFYKNWVDPPHIWKPDLWSVKDPPTQWALNEIPQKLPALLVVHVDVRVIRSHSKSTFGRPSDAVRPLGGILQYLLLLEREALVRPECPECSVLSCVSTLTQCLGGILQLFAVIISYHILKTNHCCFTMSWLLGGVDWFDRNPKTNPKTTYLPSIWKCIISCNIPGSQACVIAIVVLSFLVH